MAFESVVAAAADADGGAPKGDAVVAPKGDAVVAPKGDAVAAPKGDAVAAPNPVGAAAEDAEPNPVAVAGFCCCDCWAPNPVMVHILKGIG